MPHHGHSHGHSHGAEEAKADLFTNVNTFVGGATSFLSMLFFIARAVDTFGDYDKKFAEMSYQAMIAGMIVSLYASVGSTLCHRALNKLNQEENKDVGCKSEYVKVDDKPRISNLELPNGQSMTVEHPVSQPPAAEAALNNFQLLMLVGDFIGHAADIASPILFIMLYAFEMQKYQKAILYSGCFLLGLFGSVASVRTCRNALLKEQENAVPQVTGSLVKEQDNTASPTVSSPPSASALEDNSESHLQDRGYSGV